MNRLDRYIAKRWLNAFCATLIVLIAVYLAGEAVFSMMGLLKKGHSLLTVSMHFALKIPTIFYQMAPVAALVASLLTLTGMKKSGEITTIFVTGWGVLRLSAPFLVASIAVGLFAYHVNETMAPGANRISRNLIRSGTGSGGSVVGSERIWLIEDNHIVHIQSVQEGGMVLLKPTVLQFKGEGIRELELRVDATLARWKNGEWIAEKTYLRRFSGGLVKDTTILTENPVPIMIKPEEFFRVRRKPEEMNLSDLKEYVLSLRKAGLPANWHHVRVYRKSSAAALSLIFTVIALPVGLLVPLRGGTPLGIGLSILVALLFWSLFSLCLSMGYSGLLPAPVSAWASQVLFFSLGVASLMVIKRPRLT